MIKNVSESIKLSAWMVLGKDISKETKQLMKEHMEATEENLKAEAASNLLKSLDSKVVEELNSLGAELPTDTVEVSVKLGNVLFDVWHQNQKPPSAPLALERFRKKLSNYADLLDSEEFDIPEEVKDVASEILGDDEKWKKFSCTAFVERDRDTKVYISVNSVGLSLFKVVVKSLVDNLV